MNQKSVEIDQAKADAFSEKLVGVLNGAAISLMVSIGHRTGLFDTMAKLPHSTSEQVADEAGLNERYVREWLGAMVTGRIVDFDVDQKTYALPAEHAAFLTRDAASDNIATTTQWIAVMGQVEDEVVACFENGGGVPYSSYDRFHKIMAEESAQTVVAALVDDILPLVPGIIEKLETGIEVLDVGCGSGRALIRLAETYPQSRFTGYDFSEEAITAGRKQALQSGLSNLQLEVRDVAKIDAGERFELVTAFDAIHDQADPAGVLAGIFKSLRSGGTFLMQDIAASSHVQQNMDHPIGAFLYTISCMHCMTVSLSQNGAGLGAVWGKELAESMLRDAGFADVDVKKLPHDKINYYYVARKA